MYNLWIVAIVVAVIEIVLIVLFETGVFEFDYNMLPSIAVVLLGIGLVVLIIVSIVDPIMAEEKVNSLIVERNALQNLVESREDFDKIYITQRVVEYNKKVAQIIGNVNAFGNWSPYAFTDYELLTFIEI